MHICQNACMLVFLRWGVFTSSFSIIILKETIYIKTFIQTILIKTIIQIDKHKANTLKSFFQILKKHTYESQNTWHRFLFAYPLFQIIKKVYLQISKPWHSFFTHPLFKYWKSILTSFKIPGTVFLLILSLNIKKTYLQISKHLAMFF